MKAITDQTFKTEVLESARPVVVDFWAEWCGPCRMITPFLEELSQELGEAVEIVKVNIDENPEVPTTLGIRSIPTLVMFQGGEAKAVHTGASPKSTIKQWIETNLAK